MPAGHFACDVWGVLPLRSTARQARGALAALHLQHHQKLVGLRHSVPNPHSASRVTAVFMPDIWLLRAARFWNNLATSSGLHHRDDIYAVRLTVGSLRSGYVAGSAAAIRGSGYDMVLTAGSLPEVDFTQLIYLLRTHRDAVRRQLHASPRSAPSANGSGL